MMLKKIIHTFKYQRKSSPWARKFVRFSKSAFICNAIFYIYTKHETTYNANKVKVEKHEFTYVAYVIYFCYIDTSPIAKKSTKINLK